MSVNSDPDGCGCIVMLVLGLAVVVIAGVKKTPDKPAPPVKPAIVTLPADNLVVECIGDMPDNVTGWTSPDSLFLSKDAEVYLDKYKEISPTQKPDDIKVTKANGQYTVNLAGTKHKWKTPSSQPGYVMNGIGIKVANVEQDIPHDIPLEK